MLAETIRQTGSKKKKFIPAVKKQHVSVMLCYMVDPVLVCFLHGKMTAINTEELCLCLICPLPLYCFFSSLPQVK